MTIGLKTCIQCNEEKDAVLDFRLFRNRTRKTCIACEQSWAREVQTRNLRANGFGEGIIGDICECSACHIVKPIDEFNKRSSSKDGYSNKCRQCIKEKRPVVKKVTEMAVNVDEVLEESISKKTSQVKDVIDDANKAIEEVSDAVDDVVEEVEEVKKEVVGLWGNLKNLGSKITSAFKGLFK